MHIAQLTLVMLKATFAELGGDNYVYKYTQDFNTTGVVIDTVFNKESGAYGKKPAVIVSRGAVNSNQISAGDMGVQSIHTHNSMKTSLVQSSVEIKVLSKNSGEVDHLSNEVYNFLLMCRTVFPKMLGIHMANNPSMSPISPMEQDDHMYYCVASLPYQTQYMWRHLIPQNILNGIHLYINNEESFYTEYQEESST